MRRWPKISFNLNNYNVNVKVLLCVYMNKNTGGPLSYFFLNELILIISQYLHLSLINRPVIRGIYTLPFLPAFDSDKKKAAQFIPISGSVYGVRLHVR